MKRIVSLLLCFMLLFSLPSCAFAPNLLRDLTENTTAPDATENNRNGTTEPPKTPTDPTPAEDPAEVIESTKYYKIEKIILTTVRYTVYDSNGAVALCEETDRPLTVSMLNESVVEIRVGMGTGITRHKYYDVQNNRFSEDYESVLAASGNLVAYIDPIMKDSLNRRRLVVRDIFDKAVFYKSFEVPFDPNKHIPIDSAKFTQGEMELELTYYTEGYWRPLTARWPIRYHADRCPSEQESAMGAFSEALKNDVPVYEVNGDLVASPCSLRDIKTPSSRTLLSEIEDLKHAYLDVDGDMINELIIDCGDILILRCYEGRVCVYPFAFRNLYHLNTDGSYSWNHTGQDFEYGESRLVFDGVKLKSVELWRIVNDGEPNAAYYIGDKQVTQEEILKYFENHPKTKVAFLPLETAWENEIPLEMALEIAQKYLKDTCGDETAYQLTLIYKWDSDYSVYVFLADPYPIIIPYEIWIDKYTGEVIPPASLG